MSELKARYNENQNDILLFSHYYSKFNNDAFSTIRRYDKNFLENQERKIFLKGQGILGKVKITMKYKRKLRDIPLEFLLKDTDCKTREEAIQLLNSFYKNPISDDEELTIIRMTWIEKNSRKIQDK